MSISITPREAIMTFTESTWHSIHGLKWQAAHYIRKKDKRIRKITEEGGQPKSPFILPGCQTTTDSGFAKGQTQPPLIDKSLTELQPESVEKWAFCHIMAVAGCGNCCTWIKPKYTLKNDKKLLKNDKKVAYLMRNFFYSSYVYWLVMRISRANGVFEHSATSN